LSNLHEIIPGAGTLGAFLAQRVRAIRARFVMVEVQKTPSILFDGMAAAAAYRGVTRRRLCRLWQRQQTESRANRLSRLRYVDNHGKATQAYPFNPNGSPKAQPA